MTPKRAALGREQPDAGRGALAPASSVAGVIACPRCGWLAEVENERAAWAEHIRDGFCAEVEPIRAPKRSPYRARLCIKGHLRDEFGNCPTCRENFEPTPARAHRRRRR